MINTSKDTIKIQPIQEEYKQDVVQFDRNSMGYTDRPLNARTQVANRYLDSCTVFHPFVLDDWIIDTTLSNIYIVWNLSFKPKSFDDSVNSGIWLEIPVDWTYLINWYIELQDSDTASLYVAYTRGVTSYKISFNGVSWWISIWQTIPITWTFDLKKWDVIRYEKWISDWFSAWVSITITKLS